MALLRSHLEAMATSGRVLDASENKRLVSILDKIAISSLEDPNEKQSAKGDKRGGQLIAAQGRRPLFNEVHAPQNPPGPATIKTYNAAMIVLEALLHDFERDASLPPKTLTDCLPHFYRGELGNLNGKHKVLGQALQVQATRRGGAPPR
jgi:hypothetical protein